MLNSGTLVVDPRAPGNLRATLPNIRYKQRELLVGSPIATALDTGTPETVTVTANEQMDIDLDRPLVFAGLNADIIYGQLGYGQLIFTPSLQLKGRARQLVRGAAGAMYPVSWGVPRAVVRPTPIGGWRSWGGGETIALMLQVEGTNFTGDAALAYPCLPSGGMVGPVIRPRGFPTMLAGVPQTVAAGGAGTLTLTPDADGYIDLSGIVINGLSNEATATTGRFQDAVRGSFMTSLELPNGSDLLIGQGTPVAPLGVFHASRNANYFEPGFLKISNGTNVTVSFTNNGPDIADFTIGAPFWPSDGSPVDNMPEDCSC